MSEEVIPVHAQGFFIVSPNGVITQIVVFDYFDPKEYYSRILRGEGSLEQEFLKLTSNMQMFLDEEKVLINGKQVKPKVTGVDICLRGDPKRPSVTFFITFKGNFKLGSNTYEDYYESTIAEYDYEFYWIFFPGSFIAEVIVPGAHEVIGDRILMVWVQKGEEIEGYEKIVFRIATGLEGY